MNALVEEALQNLLEVVARESPDDAAYFRLVFTFERTDVRYVRHHAKSLQADSVSMRNLRGEWIK